MRRTGLEYLKIIGNLVGNEVRGREKGAGEERGDREDISELADQVAQDREDNPFEWKQQQRTEKNVPLSPPPGHRNEFYQLSLPTASH